MRGGCNRKAAQQKEAKIETLARALAKEFYTGLKEEDIELEVDCCWTDWRDTAIELLALI